MSNTAFIELFSEDPVERAIACRVVRLMEDQTLNEPRRVRLVRTAQRELIAHRQGFTWIDAGAAPQVGPRQAANSRAYTLQRSGIPAHRGRTDPIAERRKALGLKPTQTQNPTPSLFPSTC